MRFFMSVAHFVCGCVSGDVVVDCHSRTHIVFVELMGICDGLVEASGRRQLLLALGRLGEEEFSNNEGLDKNVPPEREIANLEKRC